MLLLRTVFNFVFMRKWASRLWVKASEFLAAGKSKSSFPVSRAEGLEEVRGSLCLGDCLRGREAREGKIREGSRKGCRGLGEAGMALSYREEVQLGSREWQAMVSTVPGLIGGKNGFLWAETVFHGNSENAWEDMPASQFAPWSVSDPGPLLTPEGRKESMGSEVLQGQGLAQSIGSALLFLKVGFPLASKENEWTCHYRSNADVSSNALSWPLWVGMHPVSSPWRPSAHLLGLYVSEIPSSQHPCKVRITTPVLFLSMATLLGKWQVQDWTLCIFSQKLAQWFTNFTEPRSHT